MWKRIFKYVYLVKKNDDPEVAKRFPTEIFVPKLQYPNKMYTVEVSKGLTWRTSPNNNNIIQIFVNPTFWVNNSEMSAFISIKPKL